MSVVAWIVLGLISGFIASNVVRSTGQGLLLDIVLGIIGEWSAGSCSRPSTRQGSLVAIHTARWLPSAVAVLRLYQLSLNPCNA